MKRFNKIASLAMALLFCLLIVKPLFSAEEGEAVAKITEGMPQGDFAMVLIRNLEAESYLPPAATIKDAFKFLEKLGVVPPKGWDEKDIVDSNLLADLLGLSKEEAAKLTFDELLEKLEKKVADILWNMGLRTVSPQTISPAGGS